MTIHDASGPYTDPESEIGIERGLPRDYESWALARGDAERRDVRPEDNDFATAERSTPPFPLTRRPLRARSER